MEQKKIAKEIFIGLFMLILSLLIIIVFIPQQIQVVSTFGEKTGVNSRTFPYFTAVTIGVAAVIHLIVSMIRYVNAQKRYSEPKVKKTKKDIHGEVLSIVIFILFAIYAFVFNKYGFITASVTIPPIVLLALGSKKVMHYVSIYGFIAIIFVIFQYLLKIQLI